MEHNTALELVVALARMQEAQMQDEPIPLEHSQLVQEQDQADLDKAIRTVNTMDTLFDGISLQDDGRYTHINIDGIRADTIAYDENENELIVDCDDFRRSVNGHEPMRQKTVLVELLEELEHPE
jgi:hypothetical protein